MCRTWAEQTSHSRACKHATVSVNGSEGETLAGCQFHAVTREWKCGDRIGLKMPTTWRFIRGRRAQHGRAAILRGPVIFTFNPHRNPEISSIPDFEARMLTIYPSEAASDPPACEPFEE
jgi:DUF1680 family protein